MITCIEYTTQYGNRDYEGLGFTIKIPNILRSLHQSEVIKLIKYLQGNSSNYGYSTVIWKLSINTTVSEPTTEVLQYSIMKIFH